MLLVCLPFSTLAMLMFLKTFKGNRIEREHTSKKYKKFLHFDYVRKY